MASGSISAYETMAEEAMSKITAGALTLGKKLIIVLLLWIIGKKLIKYVEKLVTKAFDKGNMEKSVAKFLVSLIRISCYAILVTTIIGVLGIQTTSIITLIGSAGVTVGLALQGSLSNFAGGVLILIFKPFRVGDYIVAGGYEGTVQVIDIIYTKIATVDNKIITIPNGTLANNSIVNVGVQPFRRVDLNVGIGYGADIDKAKQVILDEIKHQQNVIHEKEMLVVVDSLDSSSVTLQTRCWCKSSDYWTVRWALLENYKKALDKNGIEIPFNQLDVHIRSQESL